MLDLNPKLIITFISALIHIQLLFVLVQTEPGKRSALGCIWWNSDSTRFKIILKTPTHHDAHSCKHKSIGATFFVLAVYSCYWNPFMLGWLHGFSQKFYKLSLEQKLDLNFPNHIKCLYQSLHLWLLLNTFFHSMSFNSIGIGTFSRRHGESLIFHESTVWQKKQFSGRWKWIVKRQMHS